MTVRTTVHIMRHGVAKGQQADAEQDDQKQQQDDEEFQQGANQADQLFKEHDAAFFV